MAAGPNSLLLWEEAKKYIPGGVNSPVRAFRAVGQDPLFIARANGARVYDVDGREYLDYVCSWGPLILGHANPEVVKAIAAAAADGTSYGAPCEKEVKLAGMICQAFPSIDKVRMVNSGTEATMSAIRLARAYTGRSKIVKFEGCYHGHADSFLIKAGSGLLTAGIPISPGVPEDFAQNTLVAEYNHLDSVEELFDQNPFEIAAVIVEPVAGNMGLVLPQPQFLSGLREITQRFGALLIFDEVITGFRVAYGGFQDVIGVRPDLTCLGKIIGGGLPVGAYGGREDIMNLVAPEGPVYQAGTLSGNPLAMAAGIATLERLQDGSIYKKLDELGRVLEEGVRSILADKGAKVGLNRLGSMFSWFFTEEEVRDYPSALTSDTALYARFFASMLSQGITLPPSQFEVCFISAAHTRQDIAFTLDAFVRAIDEAGV
ncbi:MAG TPA: glutamate-1-semialdehyde 2,1-aminomutase [Syntrophothermus lipocalidus]|uniref:Glutamate-1-semialdehyde 2,1-aminomutase n=1 Tax=Syntrophothermus lipocalidus (strain DSM 12680 / TGB-C1) TaxID=643648 RepID=D7CN98_SYNLT|nr:glutamate-1-semialdehyde 2,1-aminomutase [Syntrophothermus lipocalidus]ADI02183.1 glutamate-1-semialdehyde-2,1-aminomutase [Syntrophothermus lipocalidus DSM 12680]HHV75974.1 glutamate-1-semialdehyde 2,1-aminomutase [Syntrophothermus lipocalidus]